MKVSHLIGERFKERPTGCVIDSHALMFRGGYMKYVANGSFSQYPPLRRVCRKIETILRQEMDHLNGQEVLFPVALPASLWEESGRYQSVGRELFRFQDRNGVPMVLGMTHEEAAVHLVREYAQTYAKYPFMIYQIQTKFRDEARPRGGLIRVREFTMKDAYSFHTSQKDLEAYYARCLEGYHRIFARVGIPEVIAVASDSGMMGGSLSHEFMLLTPVGEDSIVRCPHCGFCANMEAAENIPDAVEDVQPRQALSLVHTPGLESIEEICRFLHLPLERACKSVVYQSRGDGRYIVAFIRGDLEVNEAKLTGLLGEEIFPAEIDQESGLQAGYIGPWGLEVKGAHTVLFDRSLSGAGNLCCGANRREYHYTGLDIRRDCGEDIVFHDLAKAREGGICPACGQRGLTVSRGIEVGNIFQLGTKYTEAMGMQYLDQGGSPQYPLMGCYGIGVERLAASICEARHDAFGPVWPVSVAPWQVHLCCVRADDAQTRETAGQIYQKLEKMGLEVIYDDRDVRAGVMFSDADLLGVPVRIIISPRNCQMGKGEVALRDKSRTELIPLEEIAEVAGRWIEELMERLDP